MARFSLSDDTDVQNQSPAEKPNVQSLERKPRFSIQEPEKPSQFKRKSEITLKNFGKGAAESAALLYEFLKPTLKPRGFEETFKDVGALAKQLEEKFNLTPPEAEDWVERLIAGAARGGGGGLAFGPLGAMTGAVGGVAGAGAKEFGAPDWMATGADIAASALTPTNFTKKSIEKILPKTAQQIKSSSVIASEKLPPVRGIVTTPGKLITPVTTESGLKKFNVKIGRAIEAKADQIMEESLLGKRLEKEGTYIGDLIHDAYQQTEELAKANTKKIDLTNLSKIINKSAKEIEAKAPSLAGSTEEVIKKLKKYANDFSPTPPTPPKGTQLLDQYGKPIVQQKPPTPTFLSASQLTNQWQEINKELNSLYSKVELSGAEELYRKSLENVKKHLLIEAENQLQDPKLINSFKQQNKLYSEQQKFDTAKKIIDPLFESGQFNPSKMKQIFGSERKFADLKSALGEKNAYRLKDIQKYYVQPIERMKDDFKVKSLYDLGELIEGAAVKELAGIHVALVTKITPRAKARLLMSENTQNLWVRLMRSIKDGSVRGVKKYSEDLEKDLEE